MFMFRKSSEWNIKSRNGLVLTDPVIRHSLFLIPPKKNYWCYKKVEISFYNYNLPVSSSTIKDFFDSGTKDGVVLRNALYTVLSYKEYYFNSHRKFDSYINLYTGADWDSIPEAFVAADIFSKVYSLQAKYLLKGIAKVILGLSTVGELKIPSSDYLFNALLNKEENVSIKEYLKNNEVTSFMSLDYESVISKYTEFCNNHPDFVK